MKRIYCLLATVTLLTSLAVCAFAHTGPLVDGQPAWTELDINSMAGAAPVHDETQNNPNGIYKGWWFINLTNRTGVAWAGMTITTGAGDLVAIVQGNGLTDEWGITGNSVACVTPGSTPYSVLYSTSVGSGSRTYDNSAVGQLWGQAKVTFSSGVAAGQKVGFKIYTDNSWYNGPYATSFSVTLTPTLPEPGSLLALSSGLVGLVGFAIRRRR